MSKTKYQPIWAGIEDEAAAELTVLNDTKRWGSKKIANWIEKVL